MTGEPRGAQKRSLFTLIADIPRLLTDLIKSEIEAFKAELTRKAVQAGVGIGLLLGAAAFLFFAIGVLVAAAILGIAVALPAWAAALIVAGVLLVITAILVLVGVAQLKKGATAPDETIESLKKDVRAIKGIGK